MLSRKAIAFQVGNLTDARYFAAWGVSYISFTYSNHQSVEAQVSSFLEIKNWCEGIDFLLDFDINSDQDTLQKLHEEIDFAGTIHRKSHPQDTSQGILFREVKQIDRDFKNEHIIILNDDIAQESILDLAKENEVYMPLNKTTVSFLKEHADIGIILFGSPEEKVGFKSYDDLDHLLEELTEN